jgi:hypothetical protein
MQNRLSMQNRLRCGWMEGKREREREKRKVTVLE